MVRFVLFSHQDERKLTKNGNFRTQIHWKDIPNKKFNFTDIKTSINQF